MKYFVCLILFSVNAFATPNVVVSIKPIHSIVSNLMQGVGTPTLLLKGSQSAHYVHLQPSQLSAINQADLLISIHPQFEAGLAKALNNVDSNKQILVNNDTNPENHSWLDFNRMQNLSDNIAQKLSAIDPSNAEIYQHNLQRMQQTLTQLARDNTQKLTPYKNTQIAVFSTALLPFLSAHHLQKPIVITQTHGDRLSIFKIRNAKRAMQTQQTKCLLSTVEIPNKRIKTLSEGLNIATASIDIIGFNIEQGTQHYTQLMNTINHQMVQCLK
ncbi:MAG: High-affinity zinc uptake system protein ZnuA [Catillopecten margaritatus gill symbiont]|uniref:High-affinity zinc uptake system protein ZnuA n=1 Tax=Catillopecten margaritatus gill symbiont TaxID=3083288 RepID=A0AAU6PEW2_9GAMM